MPLEGVTPEMAKNTLDFMNYQIALELVQEAWKSKKPFTLRDIAAKYPKMSGDAIIGIVDTLMSKELVSFVPNEEGMKKDLNLKRLFKK
jgi:hypothetical protein